MPALTLKERLAALKARNPELFQENKAEQNKAQDQEPQQEVLQTTETSKPVQQLEETTTELQQQDEEGVEEAEKDWLPFIISTQSVAYLAANQLCLYEEVPEELSRLANDFDFTQQTQSNHYIELLYQLDNYFSRG